MNSFGKRLKAAKAALRKGVDEYQRIREMERKERVARRKASELTRLTSSLKLELGSGEVKRPGWIGIDLNPIADLVWDLSLGLPFPVASVDEIHSEHFFEHLDRIDLEKVLSECRRVLKPGARISFNVPNVRPYFEAYVAGNAEWLREKVYDRPTDRNWEIPLDVASWLALCGNQHKALFDEEVAVARLREAGFVSIRTRSFDPKVDVVERFSSLYAEGFNP